MLTVALTEFEERLAVLIHDLRQPLNTIQDSATYLRILLGDRGGLVDEQLHIIERQVDLAAHRLVEASAEMRTHDQCAGAGNLDLTNSQTAVVT